MRHAASSATEKLRRHLILVLGLAGPDLACGDTCENPRMTVTINLDLMGDGAGNDTGPGPIDVGADVPFERCPTDREEIGSLLYASPDVDCDTRAHRLLAEEGRECTYEYACYTCCGYGRPFLDESGAAIAAEVAPMLGWADGPHHPDVADLTPDQRVVIGGYWRENARAEHSSVAGFHRFALDLLAHGAPAELVARAQRAAAQELRHALDCFTLASAYLGAPIGPAPMDMGGRAVVARTLAELAAWTVRDGAVGETLAAHLAERALAGATDPAVRAVLATIVRDETAHAELAWATVKWAIDEGGDDVRDAVRAVLARVSEPTPHAIAWSPGLAAHGIPAPAAELEAARACIRDVIHPVAAALLAPPRLLGAIGDRRVARVGGEGTSERGNRSGPPAPTLR